MNRVDVSYPNFQDGEDGPLYYVEFSQWTGKPREWRLFKRQFHCSAEEWKKHHGEPGIMSREIHPWQLANGEVNERDDAEDMNTRKFLKFMVDALNEKAHSSRP